MMSVKGENQVLRLPFSQNSPSGIWPVRSTRIVTVTYKKGLNTWKIITRIFGWNILIFFFCCCSWSIMKRCSYWSHQMLSHFYKMGFVSLPIFHFISPVDCHKDCAFEFSDLLCFFIVVCQAHLFEFNVKMTYSVL